MVGNHARNVRHQYIVEGLECWGECSVIIMTATTTTNHSLLVFKNCLWHLNEICNSLALFCRYLTWSNSPASSLYPWPTSGWCQATTLIFSLKKISGIGSVINNAFLHRCFTPEMVFKFYLIPFLSNPLQICLGNSVLGLSRLWYTTIHNHAKS